MSELTHHPSSRIRRRRGVALLMVLLIVIAITILATGFLASADTELACGANVLLHMQMDQLAESALEHARGLVLHPQDVPPDFWTNGATAQQLAAGSQDYYDVKVKQSDPADYCTYDIECEAYRKLASGEKTGRSCLAAKLRLDPCIALEVGANTTLWSGVRVYGDACSLSGLINNGAIYGDVFAASLAGPGAKTGQLNPQTLALAWPPVTAGYSNPQYPTRIVIGTMPAGTYQPDSIWRCPGDLAITGTVKIKGMLLVPGDLTIRAAAGASQILAARNLPALYVGGKLVIETVNGLQIEGLAVVHQDVIATASNITVVGGLFVGGAVNLDGANTALTIIADPMRAAIVAGATGSQTQWSPAAGGFFRSIRRQ